MKKFNFKRCHKISILLLLASVAQAANAAAYVESRGSKWGRAPHAAPEESSTLNVLAQVESLQQELQELRGKVEEQNYLIQQLKEQQKQLYLDLDSRLSHQAKTNQENGSGISLDGIETAPTPAREAATTFPERPGMQVPVSSQSTLTPIPSDEERQVEERTYQSAYRLIQKRDYDSALMAFKSLLKSFPEGKYAPNAHYWLGEIYFAKNELDLAAKSFEYVFQHYAYHPKAADALLKLGYVEYAKQEWSRSKNLLSQVKLQFPGSTSAQLADARLLRMHQEGHI